MMVLVLGDCAESTAQQLRSEGISATHGTFQQTEGHYLVVNRTTDIDLWPHITHIIHLGPNQYIRSGGEDDMKWVTTFCGGDLGIAIVLVRP